MSENKIKKSIKDLEVGDKLFIKNTLVPDGRARYGRFGSLSFEPEMEAMKGLELKVICKASSHIEVLHERHPWYLSSDMIDWDKTNGIVEHSRGLRAHTSVIDEFAIEYDAEWIGGRKRGFEKVSIEQWLIDGFEETNYDAELLTEIYDDIKLPKRGTKRSAGYDIFAPYSFKLEPNEIILIPTGIKAYMQFDEMVCGYPRSSKGFKFFMRLANTVAIGDSDYYNNVKNEGHYFIKIRNEGTKTIRIEKGEAFAQFIFQKYLLADDDNFDNGEDRVGGIGSTSENK